jgi:hypothetical protein
MIQGFTAMLLALPGAANRRVIPECKFNTEHLTELLCYDSARNPSRYSAIIVSERAIFDGGEMVLFLASLSERTVAPYAPIRRNMNVVSGFITSPFISSNG